MRLSFEQHALNHLVPKDCGIPHIKAFCTDLTFCQTKI